MREKNVMSYNAMLSLYLGIGDFMSARKVFNEMGERNIASWNAMINGYAKVGRMREACELFDEMPMRNEVSYTIIISGCVGVSDLFRVLLDFSITPMFLLRDGRDWTAPEKKLESVWDDEEQFDDVVRCRSKLLESVWDDEEQFDDVVRCRSKLYALMEKLFLSLRVLNSSFIENSFIIQEGDPVNEMFFLMRGNLLTMATNGGRAGFFNSVSLKASDYCGDGLLTWALNPNASLTLPASTRTVYRNFEKFHRHLKDIPNYTLYLPHKMIVSSSTEDAFVHQYFIQLDKYVQPTNMKCGIFSVPFPRYIFLEVC
ncbi:putative cyclic nucleotide-gated ion channel 7 [Capsicum chinense]|nr:putative cyclic nucleotide-gated ion channel 7 [Capsicum chinense]